ncbi:MAG: choloylglycine hydrolase family protein [Candidatus Omnitrophota bacterium]|nr:choloylglycine hydrolase family protein [Candidatus Omnitrophota bacterium]MBU1894671.1 choloylglycine hydrolase family protein [Candidatus Omnitrophota bacterium]
MKKMFILITIIAIFSIFLPVSAGACTSFVIKAKDGSPVYGRTLEWGIFDAESELVMVPRNFIFISELGGGKQGTTWQNKYGYVAINMLKKPYYLDGMNEAGLTVGSLYFPGFAKYQVLKEGEERFAINNVDLVPYILSQFRTVKEVKDVLPKLRVVYNSDLEEEVRVPLSLHYIVTDSSGNLIVIEYVDRELKIYDDTVGVMTNSPPYDWHITNLRNYTQLSPYAPGPGERKVEGINFTPFGGGYGMTGLPGDYSPTSRFVRAFFYTKTLLPMKNADVAVNQAKRVLDNFDIPKGFLRDGTPEEYSLGYTQWSTIGDIKNKRYYWWTEWNRQMRMVDLAKIDFENNAIKAIPLDIKRVENIDDRTSDFQ